MAAKMAVKADGSAQADGGAATNKAGGARSGGARPGTDYGFSVNGEPAVYPDPRSLWQPNGVHGLVARLRSESLSVERCRISAAAAGQRSCV